MRTKQISTPEKDLVAKFLELPLTFAFYPATDRKGMVLAHCLELDVVGQGRDVVSARAALQEAVETYVQYRVACGDAAQLYSPAPADVWNIKATERWRHNVLIRVFPAKQKIPAQVSFLPGGTLLPASSGFALTAYAARC